MSRETVGLTKEENRRALVLATAGPGGRTNEQIAQALGLSIRQVQRLKKTLRAEGTLGGLVSLGSPTILQRHIDGALLQARLCASDPLCSEHSPSSEGLSLHGAAWIACLFSPETSCERGNRYLDRAALVETFSTQALAFFAERARH